MKEQVLHRVYARLKVPGLKLLCIELLFRSVADFFFVAFE